MCKVREAAVRYVRAQDGWRTGKVSHATVNKLLHELEAAVDALSEKDKPAASA